MPLVVTNLYCQLVLVGENERDDDQEIQRGKERSGRGNVYSFQ